MRRTLVLGLVATSLMLLPVPAVAVRAAPTKFPAAASGGFPFGEPAYDSGWRDIAAGEDLLLTHYLEMNPDVFVVDLQGRTGYGDVHFRYGGDRVGTDLYYGFYWSSLSGTAITVSRAADETSVTQVRVRIWVVSHADYDSGWHILPDGDLTLNHHLGGATDDYLVYLEMMSQTVQGNHVSYGVDRYLDVGHVLRVHGAHWHSLNGQRIKVYKGSDSEHAWLGRVRIWRAPPPDYDTGWRSLDAGWNTSPGHGLGGPWNDYVVDLQFRDTNGSRGVHNQSYGRDRYYSTKKGWVYAGGLWTGLSSGEITLSRQAHDETADELRVRIWASGRPKYDSGWEQAIQSYHLALTHGLRGDPDSYVVDLQFNDAVAEGDSGHGVNQQYYGGEQPDLSTHFGAYWRNLTDQQIELYRRANDPAADEIRIRIWIAPFADYDSGWLDTAEGACAALSHGAGVGTVYLEFDAPAAYEIGRSHLGYGMDRHAWPGGGSYEWGAYWKGLDTRGISVCRGADDAITAHQRVRIWSRPTPAYDSGWVDLDLGASQTLEHDLGLSTDGMVVEMQSMAGGRANNTSYGGDAFSTGPSDYEEGAYWSNLTPTSITVWRGAHDTQSSSVRVRIYLEAVLLVYLPVGLRGF
jgi:hypothetical protein